MNQYRFSKFNEIIKYVAENARLFSADEINLLARASGLEPQKNSISSAFLWAKAEGLIRRTDIAKKSNLFGMNSIPRTIWRSLIGREDRNNA